MDEAVAMERFLLVPADDVIEVVNPAAEDSFEAQLKRARLAIPVVAKSKYMNLSFVKPDTCIVERLFSQTNKVWVEGRKSMTPAHTELLLLLKCNRDLWNSETVYKCRSDPRLRPNIVMQVVDEDEDAMEVLPLQLDDPEMEGHQFAFLQDGEDGNFWDDDNIAAMLGDLDMGL